MRWLIFTRLPSPEIGAVCIHKNLSKPYEGPPVYFMGTLPAWHLVFLSVHGRRSQISPVIITCWNFFAETREIISAISASHVIQVEFSDCLFWLTVDWQGFLSFHHFYLEKKALAGLWCRGSSSLPHENSYVIEVLECNILQKPCGNCGSGTSC